MTYAMKAYDDYDLCNEGMMNDYDLCNKGRMTVKLKWFMIMSRQNSSLVGTDNLIIN